MFMTRASYISENEVSAAGPIRAARDLQLLTASLEEDPQPLLPEHEEVRFTEEQEVRSTEEQSGPLDYSGKRNSRYYFPEQWSF